MKNHAGLIRAIATLRRQGMELQLVLIGEGLDAANAELAAVVRAEGMEGSVSLLGVRHDVPALMPGLDLLVSASTYGEAFPLAVGEAMAAGVPCVVTDVGDCAWLVGDTGEVVRPRRPRRACGGSWPKPCRARGGTPHARRPGTCAGARELRAACDHASLRGPLCPALRTGGGVSDAPGDRHSGGGHRGSARATFAPGSGTGGSTGTRPAGAVRPAASWTRRPAVRALQVPQHDRGA